MDGVESECRCVHRLASFELPAQVTTSCFLTNQAAVVAKPLFAAEPVGELSQFCSQASAVRD